MTVEERAEQLKAFRKDLNERGCLDCREPQTPEQALAWLQEYTAGMNRGCTGWDYLANRRRANALQLILQALASVQQDGSNNAAPFPSQLVVFGLNDVDGGQGNQQQPVQPSND